MCAAVLPGALEPRFCMGHAAPWGHHLHCKATTVLRPRVCGKSPWLAPRVLLKPCQGNSPCMGATVHPELPEPPPVHDLQPCSELPHALWCGQVGSFPP